MGKNSFSDNIDLLNKDEINKAIKYLNVALESNALNIQEHDLDLSVFASIIDKKKYKLKKNIKHIKNNVKTESQSETDTETKSETDTYIEESSSVPIDDSISVSNMQIPSDLFATTNAVRSSEAINTGNTDKVSIH